ncbi:MAG: ferritin-like domain-containing protein [Gammaproteobacteria bacterium]
MPEDLFRRALVCLKAGDVDAKLALVAALEADWRQGHLAFEGSHTPPEPINEPGRPDKPVLVSAREVEQRKVSTLEGRAALIHSLAHIEFNAINLALDAVYRFRGLPEEYYDGWVQVAAEEAYHFTLLRDHLRTFGFDYGDFTAHNGLWDMAMKTAHDPLVRMALVPRVLEARGLDVTPAIMHKLASCGDKRAVEILEIILRDEIGHVRTGNHWYAWFCAQRGVNPIATFRQLLREHNAPQFRPPFHRNARLAAGFSEAEMAMLEGFSASD